jgi:Flp pilus assembly protein TadG
VPGPASASRRARSFGADRSGATAIEFAFIAPPLIFMLMAILQIGLVFLTNLELDNATIKLSREIRTGVAKTTYAGDPAKVREAICSAVSALVNCSSADLWIDVQKLPSGPLDSPVDATGEFKSSGVYQPGAGQDTILVRVFYRYPVWLPMFSAAMADLPNGRRLIASSAAFRNEPF